MYDGPVISGEPCKIHAAHYQFNDVGKLVCIGCLVWNDERVWPDKVKALELQVDELQKALSRIWHNAEHYKNCGTGNGCVESCPVRIATEALAEKPLQEPPNNCACPCHEEIKKLGYGFPCGEDECAPCDVDTKKRNDEGQSPVKKLTCGCICHVPPENPSCVCCP